jgi:hypothetical protein
LKSSILFRAGKAVEVADNTKGREMANRKRCEKLAIPAWFRLEAYDGLSNLTSPLDWLMQLAFRIDLKLFWQETADGHVARSSDTRFPFERDLGFDQILMQIQQDPILAVDELVKKYSHIIDFGTVNLVKRGRDPVRPMTVTDFLSIYALLDSEKRDFMDHVLGRIKHDAPYPDNGIWYARRDDAEGYKSNSKPPRISHEHGAIARYLEKFIGLLLLWKAKDSKVYVQNSILGDGAVEANRDFMSDSIGSHIPEGFTSFFAMDTNVPYAEAEIHFKKYYKTCQEKTNAKRIEPELFALWRTNGVLPYIDLQLYVDIEAALHQNPRMKINDDEIAGAIFPEGRMRDDPDRVSCITKPEADRLMDPTSALFRQLLSAAHHSQMSVKEIL